MPILGTITAETRLQTFSYVRPRTYPVHLGRNPRHAIIRKAVPPETGAKAFPEMKECNGIPAFSTESSPLSYTAALPSVPRTRRHP